jgi:hypothetical protein
MSANLEEISMTAPSSPENSGNRPFQGDLEYLAAELDWIRIRSRRIELQRTLGEIDEGTPRQGHFRSHAVSLANSADRVRRYLDEENAIRLEIDTRLALNRADGPAIGLDRMCEEYGLNAFERHVLLLAFVPTLGSNASMNSISRVDAVMTMGPPYIESVSLFMELGLEEHFMSLLCLLPERPLRSQSLIRLTYEPASPADAVTTGIELTGKALAAISGIPGFEGFTGPAA